MQLMTDAVCAVGSRHGLVLCPTLSRVNLVRFDMFEFMPEVHLRAGVVVEGEEITFPLAPDTGGFALLDQRTGACSVELIGIHAVSGIQVRLRVVAPFRPRDADFSTLPVLGLELEVQRIQGVYRWTHTAVKPEEVEAFVEIGGPGIEVAAEGDRLGVRFESRWADNRPGSGWTDEAYAACEGIPQRDAVVAEPGVSLRGSRFSRKVRVNGEGATGGRLRAWWCTHSGPALEVHGERVPFRYASRFDGLDAVVAWAGTHGDELFDNAEKVEGVLAESHATPGLAKLMAQTLHTWCLCTWWCTRPPAEAGGADREWFSVWEGSCYFHSTVDVEFTQCPFYLACWPELLGHQLDFWPEFAKPADPALNAPDARFLSHDVGQVAAANGQVYSHEMEVEETANYLIMLFAHWRRTGDDTLVKKHARTVRAFLRFLHAADTSGSGVPDEGTANTIDDASPAIQFGRDQTYLAVKTLAALTSGLEMVACAGAEGFDAAALEEQAGKIRSLVQDKGWTGEHYTALLSKAGVLKNPWSGDVTAYDEIPGWDAPHIYTANALPPLDMVGFDTGLDAERLAGDLRVATERCLREYGCVHTDFEQDLAGVDLQEGLAGVSPKAGWVSMNMSRDLAALYRGVDLRPLAERYWDWQVVCNTRDATMFFETFGGNNLHWYPRGVACWGAFDALGGVVIDRVAGVDRRAPKVAGVRVPVLLDADWEAGTSEVVES